MAKYGRAAIRWTTTEGADTDRVFLLDVPLHDVTPGHTMATYYAESLDRTKNQTITVGTGAYELEGAVKYASNPTGLVDVIRAGSQGKTLTYIPDLSDPAVNESVILVGPRSPADVELDGDRGFRGEAQVTLRFRRTDQKASPSRPRGSDVLFEYHAGDSLNNATFTRVTNSTAPATFPGVSSTADFGYGTLTTAKTGKARIGWYSSASSNGPRNIPALLLEPARQNKVKHSHAFNNWAKSSTGLTISSGQSDPAGGTNAWRLNHTKSSDATTYLQSTSFTCSTFTVASVWVKAGSPASTSPGRLRLSFTTGAGDRINIPFRFSSGVLLSTSVTNGARVAIERYRNGWYRLSGRTTAATTGTAVARINENYTNGTTGSMYAYGVQVEN